MWMTFAFDFVQDTIYVLAIRNNKEECEEVTKKNLVKIPEGCLIKTIDISLDRSKDVMVFELISFFLLHNVEEKTMEKILTNLFTGLKKELEK